MCVCTLSPIGSGPESGLARMALVKPSGAGFGLGLGLGFGFGFGFGLIKVGLVLRRLGW